MNFPLTNAMEPIVRKEHNPLSHITYSTENNNFIIMILITLSARNIQLEPNVIRLLDIFRFFLSK